MKKLQTLSDEQQKLVENHISIIHWAIHNFIKVNERIFGFEYADLYGEGCVWLCKAACTYDRSRGDFAAYAQTVVKNGLLSYSRIMCNKQARQRLTLNVSCLSRDESYLELVVSEDNCEDIISALDADSFFRAIKPRYSGIALRGIEAIELKVKGYSGKDIAEFYGVGENHVGAWISRAACKLRSDQFVLALFEKAS